MDKYDRNKIKYKPALVSECYMQKQNINQYLTGFGIS
jgi:hypothetical protein